MTGFDTFSVGVDGMSMNTAVSAGDLYADNFSAVTHFGLSPTTIHTAIEIGWFAEQGMAYQVQYCTDLNSGNWVDLGSVHMGNGTTNYTFDTARTSSERFYRVRSTSPP
jgi:hypothetical protein